MSNLKSALVKAKAMWNKAKTMKSEFENAVPDGTYAVRLTKAELGESESSGRLQVSFAAVVTGGEFKGENIRWFDGLKTEQNLMFFQRSIARMGKEVPADMGDIEDVLVELIKEKVALRVKLVTNGEFQNVRILKKLSASGDDEAPSGEEETGAAEAAPEDPEAEPEAAAAAEAEPEAEPAPEAEPETPDLEVGTRVVFPLGGKETAGEVLSLDYKEEKARVKTDAGPIYKVKFESLAPAPKTVVKKKK